MPIARGIITAFLRSWESRQLRGYIPCKRRNFTGLNDRRTCGEVIDASGVTIGTGLDLGQQDAASLKRMGLAHLSPLFAPYLGKTRDDACAALAAKPLCIDEAQCNALDEAVHADYTRRVAKLYDAASVSSGARFEDLPAEAQTVIVSLFYQLGAGSARYPVTWARLCAQDWAGAARELRTGFAKYPRRRADEARLLEQLERFQGE